MSRWLLYLVVAGILIWVVADPGGAAEFLKTVAGSFATFIKKLAA